MIAPSESRLCPGRGKSSIQWRPRVTVSGPRTRCFGARAARSPVGEAVVEGGPVVLAPPGRDAAEEGEASRVVVVVVRNDRTDGAGAQALHEGQRGFHQVGIARIQEEGFATFHEGQEIDALDAAFRRIEHEEIQAITQFDASHRRHPPSSIAARAARGVAAAPPQQSSFGTRVFPSRQARATSATTPASMSAPEWAPIAASRPAAAWS